jgi:TRAP-type mannitol/chloroaromatic compound transport system permease large subunit
MTSSSSIRILDIQTQKSYPNTSVCKVLIPRLLMLLESLSVTLVWNPVLSDINVQLNFMNPGNSMTPWVLMDSFGQDKAGFR